MLKFRNGAAFKMRNASLSMLRGHAEFLHELFDIGNFIFGDMSICFGQFTHEDKNSFKKNGLAMATAERIHTANAVSAYAVNNTAYEKTKKRSENSIEVIAD